jgi:hypothetical protein
MKNKITIFIMLISIITSAQGKFFGGNTSGGYAAQQINALCTGTAKTWDGSGWLPLGNPTLINPVIIDGNYDTETNGSIDKCVLEVTDNGLLEVKPGISNNYINIQNYIINEGIIDVFNEGSVVQIDDNALLTGSGIYNTQISTTELDDTDRFTYFSSPSQNETLNVFSSWANTSNMYQFNNTTQFWELANTTTTMNAGEGFAIKGNTSLDYTTTPSPTPITNFDGAFNNGIITQNILMNVGQQEPDATDDDSNLIGNPYPSAINADLFLNENTNIDVLYFWTHASALPITGDNFPLSDYVTWTLGAGTLGKTVNIASGQGFFALANANGTATFNNAMRVTDGNNDFKNSVEERDRIWLDLTNLSNNSVNQLAIVFIDEGTDDFDHQYDAKPYGNFNTSFYSLGVDNEPLIIQVKAPFLTNEKIIPLGLVIQNENELNHKISINHLELLEGVYFYLKDNYLNEIHDLSIDDYSFSLQETGAINDRFELIFSRNALAINNATIAKNTLIISNVDADSYQIKMKDGTVISSVKVFDVLGKLKFEAQPNSNAIIINESNKAVLFVKVYLENGQTVVKKFVKY